MISATHLTKRYGETLAVDDVSFEIKEGECVGLLGLNGAGKTTLLRMMSCLLTPSSGHMTVDGADITESPEKVLTRIGFLPDVPPLYGEMTVRELLWFAARLRRVPSGMVESRVDDAILKCALKDVVDQRIDTLSFGYKKRVGIAETIVHGPPLVILDEPIAGLDPAQIVGIRELLISLRGEHTILMSSHILTEISQICDRIFVVHEGRIVAYGTEEELSGRIGEAFRLEVRVAGPKDAALAAVRSVPGAEIDSVGQEGERETVIEVTAASDIRPNLARAVVGAGLDLLELHPKRDHLESVFLGLTGGKAGDA